MKRNPQFITTIIFIFIFIGCQREQPPKYYGFEEKGHTFLGKTSTEWVHYIRDHEIDWEVDGPIFDKFVENPDSSLIIFKNLLLASRYVKFKECMPVIGYKEIKMNNLHFLLWKLKNIGERAIPVMTSTYHRIDSEYQGSIIVHIALLKERGVNAVPFLIERIIGDEHSAYAARALGKIGPGAIEAESYLADLLVNHERYGTRRSAAIALGKIGARSEETRKALEIGIFDKDPFVRRRSAEAIGDLEFGGKETIEKLEKALSMETREYVKVYFFYAIYKLNPSKTEYYEGLVEQTKDKEPTHRSTASRMISKFYLVREDAIEILEKMLYDEDSMVVFSVSLNLGRMVEIADKVVPILKKRLLDRKSGLNKAVIDAFYRIIQHANKGEHLDSDIVDVMVSSLKLSDSFRLSALSCLGKMGKHAKSALPYIEKMKNEKYEVRKAAKEAIELIKSDR
jgi:HEAT repeat protein